MKIKDQALWDSYVVNNQDGYGAAIMSFASRWANAMEEEMGKGIPLKDCAKRLSHTANIEGITGFMYGAAVFILSKTWEHGEELRQWHNLDCQIRDEGERANAEGGVLNPAVLNINV